MVSSQSQRVSTPDLSHRGCSAIEHLQCVIKGITELPILGFGVVFALATHGFRADQGMVDVQLGAEWDDFLTEPDQDQIGRLDLAHVNNQAVQPRVHRFAELVSQMPGHIVGDGLVEGARQ